MEFIITGSVIAILSIFVVLIKRNQRNRTFSTKEDMYFESKSIKLNQEYMIKKDDSE